MALWRLRKSRQIEQDALWEQALTHRSYTEGDLSTSNERLEFLGDAVLGLVIAEHLFHLFPDWDQGHLSKARASLVRESVLCEAARRAGLPPLLRLSQAEEASGGRERPSILSDAFEAVVAALYLRKGYKSARRFILQHLQPELESLTQGKIPVPDYKSQLQERTQAWWRITPVYEVVEEHGTPHHKTFVVEVRLRDITIGRGTGSSKKKAEQRAAAEALHYIEQNRRQLDEALC
jgi:ribonuclease-3